MNRFFSLINLFPLLLIIVLLFSLVSYNQKATVEMQEIMINDWSNSATDAALHLAKRVSNIDLYGRVTLDPLEVWDEYKACFLRAANIYSIKNMTLFEGYCPATIIAVNDGYYMRMRVNSDSSWEWDAASSSWIETPGKVRYAWSQKIPYARGDAQHYWADTMNGAYIFGYNRGGSLSVLDPAHGGTRTVDPGSFVLGNEGVIMPDQAGGYHDMQAIALELIRAMDYMVSAENLSVTSGVWGKQHFYLPTEFVNQIQYEAVTYKGFVLMNLIQGFDMLGNKPVDFYTIAATQLVEATQFVCWTAGNSYGAKGYYRPVYLNHPKFGNTMDTYGGRMSAVPTGSIMHVVSSREQAARLGYYPDPGFYGILN